MIVGLTGGIGSGKSTVATMFSELGIPVYIADDEAKELMNTSMRIREQLIALFGEEAYKENELNRPYIAGLVFNDKEKLQQLNAIVHPEVNRHFKNWYEQQKSPYVIKEAAILFENGGYRNCDLMITVTAPVDIRIQRVLQRDGGPEEDIRSRMRNQWKDEDKIALSDFVIENTDLIRTSMEVEKIHKHILAENQ
ncbi:dephospho-CoA kinase [Leptobacterium flavescens]|uniref:Dephospho-CoA kinase n=1 Tax=Leptobacterium flavescens TaxID=472055 RepID=A0A6P0UJC5_9FLAO|nr:dephospho-CoA kinase [Leptobacterium flavescens]NER13314.1 dephospho-CoA kinase [Leptobacterium flavescens]